MLVRPEPPERVQFVVRVTPETKRRLEWVAEQIGWSVTKILEQSAANKERIVLADLPPEHREAYRAGTLDLDVAFPGKRFRRRDADVPDEVVVLSAKITTEARRQFELYSKLTREPLAVVIDKLSVSMERRLKKRPPPDPEQPKPGPALDENMASRMEPSEEDA